MSRGIRIQPSERKSGETQFVENIHEEYHALAKCIVLKSKIDQLYFRYFYKKALKRNYMEDIKVISIEAIFKRLGIKMVATWISPLKYYFIYQKITKSSTIQYRSGKIIQNKNCSLSCQFNNKLIKATFCLVPGMWAKRMKGTIK